MGSLVDVMMEQQKAGSKVRILSGKYHRGKEDKGAEMYAKKQLYS